MTSTAVDILHTVFDVIATPCSVKEATIASTRSCLVGVENEVLYYLLRACNFTFSLKPLAALTSDGDGLNWRSSTTELAFLRNGSFDMLNTQYAITEHRMGRFKFAYPAYQASTVLLTRTPQRSVWQDASRLFNCFGPSRKRFFPNTIGIQNGVSPAVPEVYMWSAITALLLITLLTLVDTYALRHTPHAWTRVSQLKGVGTPANTRSSRNTLLVAYGILTVTIFSLYQKALLAGLYLQPQQQHFTILELIEKMEVGEIRFVVHDEGDYFHEQIMYSNSSMFKRLRNVLQRNPPLLASDLDHAIRIVQTGQYVIPLFQAQAEFYAERSCDSVDIVQLGGLGTPWQSYIFNQNTDIDLGLFNHSVIQLQGLQEVRMTRMARSSSIYRKATCPTNADGVGGGPKRPGNKLNPSPLGWQTLLGCFLLLGIGLLLATVSFVVEISWGCSSADKSVPNFKSDQPNYCRLALVDYCGEQKQLRMLDELKTEELVDLLRVQRLLKQDMTVLCRAKEKVEFSFRTKFTNNNV